jgi:hypothetical protein
LSWSLSSGGVRAELDIDFVNGRAKNGASMASIASLLTCTRASSGYYSNAAGVLTSIGTDTLRYGDQGLLVEEGRTNVVLHNRDLTNAAWTKTDCTAAKTQTGPDGVVNSASSLTATGANATCLQAITLASSDRFQTAYVKRLTGSGTVNMTMDNGSTWTVVTVTAGWTRVSIPTQTLANPTVGFRIVTSGDAIAIDLVDNENSGSFATSPIATTTTSVARAQDVITFATMSWFTDGGPGTGYTKANVIDVGHGATSFELNAGSEANSIRMGENPDSDSPIRTLIFASGGLEFNSSTGTISDGVDYLAALGWATNDARHAINGTLGAHDTSVTLPTGINAGRVGANSENVAVSAQNGHIKRVAYWNSRIADAGLQALTT